MKLIIISNDYTTVEQIPKPLQYYGYHARENNIYDPIKMIIINIHNKVLID